MHQFKSGYVAIVGSPNVGKSTLLNSILHQKLSIVTNKPQTTRKRIIGIFNDEESQIIFLDTPGLLKPNYLLQEKFIEHIKISLIDADLILLLIDSGKEKSVLEVLTNELLSQVIQKNPKKIIIAINKIDTERKKSVSNMIKNIQLEYPTIKIIPISALQNTNIEVLVHEIKNKLPIGPKYYPDEQLAEENERFFVSEIIREKIFENYSEEIPFSTEVIIEDYKERENGKDYISALVFVEKESQKPIIIGKNGESIKRVGKLARRAIEEFIGKAVYLELRVKVKSKWRSDPSALKSFGYNIENEN